MSMTAGERVEIDKLKAEFELVKKQLAQLDIAALTAQLDRVEVIGETLSEQGRLLDRTASQLQGHLAGLPGPRAPMPEVEPPKTLVDFGLVAKPEKKRKKRRRARPVVVGVREDLSDVREARPNRSMSSDSPEAPAA